MHSFVCSVSATAGMRGHRARDCPCDTCAALGRIAAVVVDDDTTEGHREVIARILEKAYTRILEKGLRLLRQERQEAAEETAGGEGHPRPGEAAAEPPAAEEEQSREIKKEPREEATKKKRRRKKKPQVESEVAEKEEKLPVTEVEEAEAVNPVETPAESRPSAVSTSAEAVVKPEEKDSRLPLPRRSVRPSSKPLETLKEKKERDEPRAGEDQNPRFVLKPKAKAERRRSRSRSRGRVEKDKKRRRSPSPLGDWPRGDDTVSSRRGGEEAAASTEVEPPPGNWEDSNSRSRRPRSPDHPPPLPRRPTRGQLWIGPIRAYKNKPIAKKKSKGLKKEEKNQRYWERRRQRLWEERTRGFRRR